MNKKGYRKAISDVSKRIDEIIIDLELFKDRNSDTTKDWSPSRFEEDKMYNLGLSDVCKKQIPVLNKIINKLKILKGGLNSSQP